MTNLEGRRTERLAGVLVCAALAACGGSKTTTPTPMVSATPTPCTQAIVGSAQGSLPAHTLGAIGFTTAAAGRIDATVDWTLATSPIGVYIVPVNPVCDIDSFNARSCSFLVVSEPSSVKPRKVSASSAAGGIYQLLVANFGDDDESASGQVVLSLGPCPAFTVTVPSANRRMTGPELTMREVGRLR